MPSGSAIADSSCNLSGPGLIPRCDVGDAPASIQNSVGSLIVNEVFNEGTLSEGHTNGITVSSFPTPLLPSETHVGTVTNNGTLVGHTAGINVSAYGTEMPMPNESATATIAHVYNTGIIKGQAALGRASDASSGIAVTAHGEAIASISNLDNSGTITGSNGILVSTDYQTDFLPYTVAGGAQASIETLTNSGNIAGTSGSGVIVNNGGVMGTIDNRGEIRGASSGIALLNNARINTISNSGKIVGDTGIVGTGGVNSLAGIDFIPLRIDNLASGEIQGTGGVALDLAYSAIPAIINNHGKIDGDVKLGGNQIYGFAFSPTIVPLSGSILNLEDSSRVTGKTTGGPSSSVNVRGNFVTEDTFDVGQFSIGAGARLAMNHDISVQTHSGLRNSGILSVAAGKSVVIHGDYVQEPNGIFETGVNGTSGATEYGKLEVSGTANLLMSNKIGVRVTSEDTVKSGVLADVLKAGTLVAAPFDNPVVDNSALWNFTASKNGNSIDLKAELAVVPSPVPTPAPTPQPQPRPNVGTAPMIQNTGIGMPAIGAARIIDQFLVAGNATGDMQTVLNNLGALGTQQEVAQAVSQFVPVMTGALAQSTLGAMHGTNRVVQARMETARGLSSGDEVKTNHGWIKPFGSWANQGDHEGVSGYRSDTYGFVLGADKEVARSTRLGAAFSYSNTRVKGNADASAKVDTYQAIIYGSHSLDERTEVNFQADVGMNSNDTSRRIRFGDLDRSASADYNSWNTHLGVGIGRLYAIGSKTTFTPSLRADYLYIRDRGYTESGADALDLNVDGKSTDELVFGVDGKVNYALTDTVDLTANLGVGYDALSGRSSITTAFVGGGAAFVTEGADPSPWLGRGGLGLSTRYANGLEVAVRYDVEARKHFTNQTASLKLRMPF